jgi:hypothetical protein
LRLLLRAFRPFWRDQHHHAQVSLAAQALAEPPQALKQHPDVPVGHPVADEQQRRAGDRLANLIREQLGVLHGRQKRQVVVLGQDD